MKFENIHEPIEVITHFKNGKQYPLRFKWSGRVYKVKQWNGYWMSRQGKSTQHFFSIRADNSDRMVLVYDDATLIWQIARVCLEG